MTRFFALVDCNNFYTSCEKLFFPSLEGKPVVVLSNNDGCIIARSEEAKKLGIKMGAPVFEIPDVIEKNNVHVFSTNYALYGDVSQRVMNTLAGLVPDMEIYSIDEAFIDLSHIPEKELFIFGQHLKDTVQQWTGIPVSVGIGPTKTLAKVANHLAKADKSHNGVFSIINERLKNHKLADMDVSDIWGVGEKYSNFFMKSGMIKAADVMNADEYRIREHLGVVGQRLVLELRGTVCYPLNDNPESKKEICTSRSFGHPVTRYDELEEATASYVSKVGQKLRSQKMLAGSLLIFIMTNKYATGPQYVNYKIVKLPAPSNQTNELIHFARIALKALYLSGYQYKKSGIIVSDLIPDKEKQTSLWRKDDYKQKRLIEVIDNINAAAGIDKVKFAVQGMEENWKMRQHNMSPRYTTRWEDILVVNLDSLKDGQTLNI